MDFLRNVIIGSGNGSNSGGLSLSNILEGVDTGSGKREDGLVSFGYMAKQGRRGNMEDTTFAQFKRCKDGQQFGFFGVFDGHGGPGCAEYVKKHLFVNLENDPSFPQDMATALKNAFQQTDTDYLNAAGARDEGCTGVVAVVQNRQAWIAHVGDSRAVLVKSSGQVQALSEDHKPNRESERRRIEGEGGVVIWAGTWRVGGVLAVSRAFGDRPLKRYVIALPDVHQQNLDSGEEVIVLASDGLWDVLANEDAGEMVVEHKDPKIASKQLAQEAYRRGSADNISCIVIRFAPC